jgi:hypothetical protein
MSLQKQTIAFEIVIRLFFLLCAALSFFLSCSTKAEDSNSDDSISSQDDDSGSADADDTHWGGDDSIDDAQDDSDNPVDDDDDDTSIPRHSFIAEVIDYEIGESGGYGEEYLPDSVIGPPAGAGADEGNNDPEQVFSLGHGGSITLRMSAPIADCNGPDFTIFENPFRLGGNDNMVFIEAAFVEASENGIDFTRFPNDYDASGGDGNPQAFPGNFHGFAGLNPVFAGPDPDGDGNPSDAIDPGDPSMSGGDLFDLADVGLATAQFIRIIDTGSIVRAPGTESYDDDGTLIEDQGNLAPLSGNKDGFDIDAIVVLNEQAR